MNFPCLVCGLCCEKAATVFALQTYIGEDGRCRNYDPETKKCRTYSHRPMICDTGKMYKAYFQTVMSEREFILQNLAVCYALNKEKGCEENARMIRAWMKKIRKM